MDVQVTFSNGNKQVSVKITGSRTWEKDAHRRIYFDIDCVEGKRHPIGNFYEILEGQTRDKIVEVEGRRFGYEYGVDANSNSKRRAIDEAVQELASLVVKQGS